MKRVAILRCLKSNDVCTGAACLKALSDKKGSFEAYRYEELVLKAFFSCNGCDDCKLKNQIGLQEKLDKLLEMQVEIVFVGVCTLIKDKNGSQTVCEEIVKIKDWLIRHGIVIVEGTH
ncbi:MAG: CGGC domain-containing protein [Phascolarctobacterium sp.]|nr:CGGC domain-containing protein [Phascolarctobacterium sp.]